MMARYLLGRYRKNKLSLLNSRHQSTEWDANSEQFKKVALKVAWKATSTFEKLHFCCYSCPRPSPNVHVTF